MFCIESCIDLSGDIAVERMHGERVVVYLYRLRCDRGQNNAVTGFSCENGRVAVQLLFRTNLVDMELGTDKTRF